MGIRDAWRALRGQKASEAGSLVAMVSGLRPQWTPRNYKKFADEAYTQNVVAYRAMNEVSQAAASVPWKLFSRGRNGQERTEIVDHPLLRLLRQPNPQQGQSEFVEAVLGYFQLAGNSYIEAVGPDTGPPLELWTLRPDRMKVIPGKTGMPQGYRYAISEKTKDWDVDPITGQGPILHLRRFHPTHDWYGLSPIEAIAKSVDQRNEADRWNLALLQNEARPSGAVVYEPKDGPAQLSDPQFARVKDEINRIYSGADNAGKPMVFDGGLKWEPMSLNPKDMDFLNVKNTSSRDIALGLGVPPQLLGIPGDNTFSNYREARSALWEDTVIPTLRHLRDEWNNWLVPMFVEGQAEGALELDLDLDGVPALTVVRERTFEMAGGADFLTVNEKRAMVGMDEVEGGDVILVSATMLPLAEAGEGDDENDDTGEPDDDEAGKLVRLVNGDPPR